MGQYGRASIRFWVFLKIFVFTVVTLTNLSAEAQTTPAVVPTLVPANENAMQKQIEENRRVQGEAEVKKILAAKEICGKYSNPKSQKKCSDLPDCASNMTCGDLRAALDNCAAKLKANGSEDSEEDDTPKRRENKERGYQATCFNYFGKKEADVSGKLEAKEAQIFKEFIGEANASWSNDFCKGMSRKDALQYLTAAKKEVAAELKDAETSLKDAKKAQQDAEESCHDKSMGINKKLEGLISNMQQEAARLQNEVVERNAKMTSELNAMKAQLALAKEAINKMKTIDNSQLEAEYFNKVEQVKQVCYENADKQIEIVKSMQDKQAAGQMNQASSVSQVITNAAQGGNHGQNKQIWESFVQTCLARRAPMLTALYNESILKKQNLAVEVNKASIQIADLMTKIANAERSSRQQGAAAQGMASARLNGLQREQSLANIELQNYNGPTGICTRKLANTKEELEKKRHIKEDLEQVKTEMSGVPTEESTSAQSADANKLKEDLKALTEASASYTTIISGTTKENDALKRKLEDGCAAAEKLSSDRGSSAR